ncbi:MAG: InlB B-repeat-containing protein [Oscillospiraceae bacterium]|nr:InlB B-repeat-containing protein [Oscillospiraceae bacterium]
MTYSESANGTYGATNPTYKNAGEYVVYYRATAEGASDATGSAVVRIAKATLDPELTLVDRHNTDRIMNAWVYNTLHGVPKLVVRRGSPAALQGPLALIASLFAGQGEIVTDYGAVNYRCKENGYDYGILSDEDVAALSVGEYTLRVDIAESANYYAAFAETSFRVTKAPHDDITIGPITVAAGASNLTADLSAYLVDGASCAAAGTSGTLAAANSAAMTESGTAVRFDTASVSGDAQGAVKVTVSSRNYQDYAITVQLTAGEAFTLRFDSAGGSAVTETKTLRAGEPVGTLPTTARNGYTFAGWHAADGAFTEQSAMPGADTTLVAHWTPDEYTVTLRYLYGGMTDAPGWTYVEGSYNETYEAYETWARSFRTDSESFELPEPIRNGYAFLGWTGADGKSAMRVTIPQGTAENLVYEAAWKIGERHGEVTFVKEADDSNVLGFVGLTQDASEATTQRSDTFSDSGYDATDAAHTMRAIAAADETPVAQDATKNVKAELYGKTLPNFAGRGGDDLSDDELQLQQEQNAIYALAQSVFPGDDTMKVDYMDIRVKKTVTALKGGSMDQKQTDLTQTPTVEIPLRYDLAQGRVRHGGVEQASTGGVEPEKPEKEGVALGRHSFPRGRPGYADEKQL